MHVHEDVNFICPPPLSSKSFPTRRCVTIKSILNNILALVRFGNPLVILVVMLLQYYCIRRRILNCTSSHFLLLKHIKRHMRMRVFLLSSQMSLAKQFIPHQRHSHQMKRLQNLRFTPMMTRQFYLLPHDVPQEGHTSEEFVRMQNSPIAQSVYFDVEGVERMRTQEGHAQIGRAHV